MKMTKNEDDQQNYSDAGVCLLCYTKKWEITHFKRKQGDSSSSQQEGEYQKYLTLNSPGIRLYAPAG